MHTGTALPVAKLMSIIDRIQRRVPVTATDSFLIATAALPTAAITLDRVHAGGEDGGGETQ